MKLDARRLPAFLRDPGPARAVLLHGDDEGMVRHRAGQLTQAIVGARDDPFRVAWLSREDHARLSEEASAIAMMGGRRVVRVRDAGDALTQAIKAVLDGPGDSLVVLEAGALPGRSKLRALLEAAPNGAALACYPEDGKALRDAIEGGLQQAGLRLDADALEWLLDHVGADRGATRGEVEKLVLYAGSERTVGLDAVRACVGDQAAVSFDDAVFAATLGDVALADRSIERTLAEGMAPVAVVRGVLGHLARLHLARGHMTGGMSAGTRCGRCARRCSSSGWRTSRSRCRRGTPGGWGRRWTTRAGWNWRASRPGRRMRCWCGAWCLGWRGRRRGGAGARPGRAASARRKPRWPAAVPASPANLPATAA